MKLHKKYRRLRKDERELIKLADIHGDNQDMSAKLICLTVLSYLDEDINKIRRKRRCRSSS